MERVTFQHTPDGEAAAVKNAKAVNRLAGIIRTSRLETASRPQQGGNPISVQRNQREANRFQATSPESSAGLGVSASLARLSTNLEREVPAHPVLETPILHGPKSIRLAHVSSNHERDVWPDFGERQSQSVFRR